VLRIDYSPGDEVARQRRAKRKLCSILMFFGVLISVHIASGIGVMLQPTCRSGCHDTLVYGAMKLFIIGMAVTVPIAFVLLMVFASVEDPQGLDAFMQDNQAPESDSDSDLDDDADELGYTLVFEDTRGLQEGQMPTPIPRQFGVQSGVPSAIGAGMVTRDDSWSLQHPPRPGMNMSISAVLPPHRPGAATTAQLSPVHQVQPHSKSAATSLAPYHRR
jgi:hypothetical protein